MFDFKSQMCFSPLSVLGFWRDVIKCGDGPIITFATPTKPVKTMIKKTGDKFTLHLEI